MATTRTDCPGNVTKTGFEQLFASWRRARRYAMRPLAAAVAAIGLAAGCQGQHVEPAPTATPATVAVTTPAATGELRHPDCATHHAPQLCDRVVDDVLSIASFGAAAPTDVILDSRCDIGGCQGTLSLYAPDGFGIIATLTSSGPNEPWVIRSIVRDPGGPVPLPSRS